MTATPAPDLTTQTLTLSVSDGTAMPCYVARPAGTPSGRGLLVFQEAFGVTTHIRDVTERFAREGYTAVAPALFHRTAPNFEGDPKDFPAAMRHVQALTDAGLAVDVRAAFAWLTAADGGGASAVGSVGYCMGGRVSFLADAELPLRAAVSYYGGGIAPNPRRPGPDLLGRAGDLHGPILLFWGGQDAHIDVGQTRAVEDALRAAGKDYVQVTFARAGHGFFSDDRPSYEPNAARQSWVLALAFLRAHLGGH